MRDKSDTLTPLEMALVQEYFSNGMNKSEAFRKCHRSAAGWRESTIWARASKFFAQEHIQKYIAELHERANAVALERFDITAEKVLDEIAKIAFSDIRRLFDGNRVLLPGEMHDNIAASVSSIEVASYSPPGESAEIEYTSKFKLHSKLKALEFLAGYLGITKGGGTPADKASGMVDYRGGKIPAWMEEMIPGSCDPDPLKRITD